MPVLNQNYNFANYRNNGFQNNRMNNGYNHNSQSQSNGYYNNDPQIIIDDRLQLVDYVSGRAGADAYQLPPNINKAILFDNDTDRFFIKGYDNNGRPRVLEDKDFQDHVEPEPQPVHSDIDLTPYATKDDIKNMITEALASIQQPNMSSYVTKSDLNKALGELAVGNGGRIVRNNEQDA